MSSTTVEAFESLHGCTVDAFNAAIARAELVRAHYEGLTDCACYVHSSSAAEQVQLWTGLAVGTIVYRGTWHRMPNSHFGTKWRAIRVVDLQGRKYFGREFNSQQLVRLRQVKS